MPDRPCDPAVVGSLAVLQSTLQMMPVRGGLASLVEAGLERVPGVTGAELQLLEAPAADGAAGLELPPRTMRFHADTLHARWGWLELAIGDELAFAPYAAYVSNLVNVVAQQVEALHQRAELERLLRERTQITAELREADRRKDEFLGMLSHELRNPLAPIRSSLFVLERSEPASEQARRAREVVRRQVQHLARLVDDLLDVTRISRGRLEVIRAPLDLGTLVRRAAEDHHALMQQRRLELAVDAPEEELVVEGDETRLAQVIGNLLHNAAKFTAPGGRVALSLRAAGAEVEIRLRDTGVGIAPELQDRIFEPFEQGAQTIARSEGGLGLGLALVKKLVELHGGTVTVESEIGRGSEFTVRLPRLERSGPGASGGEASGREAVRQPRRVLIVDDNRDAAESMADLVAMFGHEPAIAYDGPAAIEQVSALRPDVVLCDIGLPGMDGYAVARAIRALAKGPVKLVALSGYAQPEDLSRAAEAGFELHLAKPAEPEHIERLLVGA